MTNFPQTRPRRAHRRPQLITVTGLVRSVELTPLGHVSCVLDSSAGRLTVFSDAAVVHLPQLRAGTRVQAMLLQIRREASGRVWHWQLLCCRESETTLAKLTNKEWSRT